MKIIVGCNMSVCPIRDVLRPLVVSMSDGTHSELMSIPEEGLYLSPYNLFLVSYREISTPGSRLRRV